jgi:O-antigen/teichoic acid export membrane protein
MYFKRGIKGIYEAQIIGHASFLLMLAGYTVRNIRFTIELRILKEMLKFSFPLVLGSISATILTIFDRFSLNYLATLDDVGIYSLGYRIANTIKIVVVTSIQLAISPVIFQKMYDSDNKRFYSKLMTYQGFLIGFLVLIVSIYGYEIIKVFTSNDVYLMAVYIIPVISLSILFGLFKDMAIIGLQISKKTSVIGLSIFIVTAVNMVLNIVLIPYLKINGASVSTLISQIILFIIILKAAQKQYYIPYEIRKIMLLIAIIIIISIPAILVNNMTLLFRLLIKTTLLASFPILLYLFGFFEVIEIQRIKEAFNKWKNPRTWINYFIGKKP